MHVIILITLNLNKLKKVFFIVVMFAPAFVQNSFAQEKTTQPSQILQSYFSIKNALVAGNTNNASMSAQEFVKALNGADPQTINETSRSALLKDAGQISENRDIKHQREHFATFSTDMYALAKSVKLTGEPGYYAYCPMKKAYWLSNEAVIKNPYYGSVMLTFGKVTETLK